MDEKKAEALLVNSVAKQLKGKCYKWVSPGNAGVPDRIIVLPSGNVVFVEMKASGGRLSAQQRAQLRKLRKLGQKSAVVYGEYGVIRLLGWLATSKECDPFWRGHTYIFTDKYIVDIDKKELK